MNQETSSQQPDLSNDERISQFLEEQGIFPDELSSKDMEKLRSGIIPDSVREIISGNNQDLGSSDTDIGDEFGEHLPDKPLTRGAAAHMKWGAEKELRDQKDWTVFGIIKSVIKGGKSSE